MKKIIVIIILVIIIKYINDELLGIIHLLNYLLYNKAYSAVPLPKNIRYDLLQIIAKLPLDRYKFIEFGCADGEIIELVKNDKKIYKIDGIEIDKDLYTITKMRFNKDDNIKIYNDDMQNYKFENTASILYMYEPLWTLDKRKALEIYNNIFSKIPNNNNFYVIYISGIEQKLNDNFFYSHNLKKIYEKSINRIFGNNNIYLLKFIQ